MSLFPPSLHGDKEGKKHKKERNVNRQWTEGKYFIDTPLVYQVILLFTTHTMPPLFLL